MSFSKAFVFSLALATTVAGAQTPRRIVAIGDVHGAYDQFVAILTQARLIDRSRQWAGGRTVFVQTGDYTDRGDQVRAVLDLLLALEASVKGSGGEVMVLAGNHEILNMLGDLRYVTPQIASAFADAKSESRRERAWTEYERLVADRTRAGAVLPPALRHTRETWMTAHPPGWLEYRESFAPRGRYGKWLRGKSIAGIVDGTLFMHAGINPDRFATVDDVNRQARQEIARYDNYLNRLVGARLALPFFTMEEVLQVTAAELESASRVIEQARAKNEPADLSALNTALLREGTMISQIGDWSLLAGDGPLWFRGYANWPEEEMSRAKIDAFLQKSNLKRIVVGHTPTKDARIATRFNGRVVLIDTGMLTSVYKGRPSALEIAGDELNAIYEDGSVPLSPAKTAAIALAR